MKITILILVVICILGGCKTNDNPIYSTGNQTSVAVVRDSLQYTFAIPKSTFGIHDSISATMSVYNQSSQPETVLVGNVYGLFLWSLKNDSDQIVMFGPRAFSELVGMLAIDPKESKEIFNIPEQPIVDTSGASLTPGKYVLQSTLYRDLMSFSLTLTLQ